MKYSSECRRITCPLSRVCYDFPKSDSSCIQRMVCDCRINPLFDRTALILPVVDLKYTDDNILCLLLHKLSDFMKITFSHFFSSCVTLSIQTGHECKSISCLSLKTSPSTLGHTVTNGLFYGSRQVTSAFIHVRQMGRLWRFWRPKGSREKISPVFYARQRKKGCSRQRV